MTGTNKVAIRFKDGRVLKGTTQDFVPGKPFMHLHTSDSPEAVVVEIEHLKAVFFVKDFTGDSTHADHRDFPDQVPTSKGRKIVVVFNDNEVMAGYTFGYDPGRSGFFVVPSDEDSNNDRAFVVRSAVKEVGLGLKADQILARSR